MCVIIKNDKILEMKMKNIMQFLEKLQMLLITIKQRKEVGKKVKKTSVIGKST